MAPPHKPRPHDHAGRGVAHGSLCQVACRTKFGCDHSHTKRQHRLHGGGVGNAHLRCPRLSRHRQAARIRRRRGDDRVHRPHVHERVVGGRFVACRTPDVRHREHPRCQLHDGLARDHDDRRRSIASACDQRRRESQLHVWRLVDTQCRRIGRGATVGRADLHAVWRRHRREHRRADDRERDRPGRRRAERGKELIDRRQRRLHPDESGRRQFLDPRKRKRLQRDRAGSDRRAGYQARFETGSDSGVTAAWASTVAVAGLLCVHHHPGHDWNRWLPGREFHGVDFEDRGQLRVAGQLRCELDHVSEWRIWKRQRHARLYGCHERELELTVRQYHDFVGGRQRSHSSPARQLSRLVLRCLSDQGIAGFRQRSIRWRPVNGHRVQSHAVPSVWNQQCSASINTNVPWITGGGTVNGGGPNNGTDTFTFTVAPNPPPGGPRSGSLVATGSAAPAGSGGPRRLP